MSTLVFAIIVLVVTILVLTHSLIDSYRKGQQFLTVFYALGVANLMRILIAGGMFNIVASGIFMAYVWGGSIAGVALVSLAVWSYRKIKAIKSAKETTASLAY